MNVGNKPEGCEGLSHEDIWKKRFPQKKKGPDRQHVEDQRNSKEARMAGAEKARANEVKR